MSVRNVSRLDLERTGGCVGIDGRCHFVSNKDSRAYDAHKCSDDCCSSTAGR